jgi:hypothetical protein
MDRERVDIGGSASFTWRSRTGDRGEARPGRDARRPDGPRPRLRRLARRFTSSSFVFVGLTWRVDVVVRFDGCPRTLGRTDQVGCNSCFARRRQEQPTMWESRSCSHPVGRADGRSDASSCLRGRGPRRRPRRSGPNFRSPFRSLNEPKFSICSHKPMRVAKVPKNCRRSTVGVCAGLSASSGRRPTPHRSTGGGGTA